MPGRGSLASGSVTNAGSSIRQQVRVPKPSPSSAIGQTPSPTKPLCSPPWHSLCRVLFASGSLCDQVPSTTLPQVTSPDGSIVIWYFLLLFVFSLKNSSLSSWVAVGRLVGLVSKHGIRKALAFLDIEIGIAGCLLSALNCG